MTPGSPLSIAQQMLQDGSAPDMPSTQQGGAVPMRAVVAAASTQNPDAEAHAQQLSQQTGMGVDLVRHNPQAAQQRATAADLDRRDLEITNPILARQLQDPNFAGVAHDDLDSLTAIEQGAAQLRAQAQNSAGLAGLTPTQRQAVMDDRTRAAMEQYQGGGGIGFLNRAWAETKSVAGNIDAGVFGAAKPLIDAGGAAVQGVLESPKPLMDAATGLDPDLEGLKNVWVNPRTFAIQRATGAVQDYLLRHIQQGPQQYLTDPQTGQQFRNPDYAWWGRNLVNAFEQVPGQYAAFYAGGAGAGAAGEAASAEGSAAEISPLAGTVAPGAMAESQSVPALLGTQAAQTTYAQARARGADQKTAIAAALTSGLSNYALMGRMPGPVETPGVLSAAGQWAGRSVAMGTGMTVTDNAIARSYDPNRSLLEGLPQSIATMGAFEGVGGFGDVVSHITDAVAASKLAKRAPEVSQQNLDANFEGDESLRIPAQEFVDYFQGKKLDPAAMANQVGVTNLEEAAAAGSDLEIPKANFFGKLDPEHQKGLLPDVVDPSTDLTMKQAEAGRTELQDWVSNGGAAKLQAEYEQADAETQATPEWQQVQSDLKQRYVDAGETDTAADSYATLQANAIANLAKNAGLKPDELLALHNPKLTVGEAPGTVLHQSGVDDEGSEVPAEPAAAPPGASPRGWFQMRPDGSYEIGKTSLGDMSTFIHEPAHAYLEMFRELTQREGASQPLKDDFDKIAKWLGTTPEEAYEHGFTTEQHEQWARANEEYVREGKAPSSGLTRAFHNFSVWLSSIYRRAGGLGVEMSPDIRGVMDRLYAGEDAVNRAGQESSERLFASPEEAGWTDAEYRNYADAKGLEVDKAREQVKAEMNEAAARETTQKWREARGDVRDAVTEQLDARPEYTAIRSLRRGKLDDGTEMTLNRDELVKQFGEDRVKALQKLHPGLYRSEGGTDAETAGELFGFGSGDEMMRALEAAPRRSIAIEQGTRDYLVNKYGDVRYDGTLMDRARFNLENQERAGSIYRELRALRERVASLTKKAADVRAVNDSIAPLEHYQEAAARMVDQKSIADLQPSRYLNATRMFSREAFDALRKGDAQRAAEAKNKELLNHFLYREAVKAQDYAGKFESYAKRMQSIGIQQRMGLAGSDYREQFNWLLARYKLGPTPVAPERPLRAWADDVYSNGNEPAIAPGILNEGKFADYRNVPLSEIHDVHDALVNIRHLAMQEFKMFVQGKQVRFADAKQSMIESARENLKSKPEKIFDENRGMGERIADKLQQGDALLVRMERMIEWLDGGKTGPWHDNLWNLSADAQGDEYDLQEKVTKPISDAIRNIPDEMRRRMWTEKVAVDGIPEALTRRRLVSIAMNMGNEGNLDRLQKTFDHFGWDRDAISKIGGMLTRDEWQFVQKTWDSLKPIGDRMNELQKRLTGLPPAMVKAIPFKVALDDGGEMQLDGGYFPIRMDPRFSDRGVQQDAKESAQNAMQSGYVRATTSKGYTKERTGFGGPLDLDFERALTDHLAKATKDLSHREFMLSSQRLLLDTEVRKSLRETLGPAYEKQFMPWLRTIINDRNGSVGQGVEAISNAMQALRGNIVAASVGFKVSTALLQISHAPRMLLYAKPGSLAQALGDFLARPREITEENRELSPNEMRFRGDNLDRDVRAVLQNPTFRGGYEQKVATAARWTLQTVDHLFSHTLWRAAYNDGLRTYADLPVDEAQQKAVYEADSAVRLGLGTSAPKDLPAIMRNNDMNKLLTTLYGFHNGVYNQLRDNAHQFMQGGSVGKLTYATILTAVLPAVLGSLVTGDGPKNGENPGLWAAKRALLFSADTIPVLGSIAEYMANGHDMQFTPIESVMQQGAKAAMEAAADKPNKDWMGVGLDAGGAAGELFGVPGSQQVVKTIRYIRRANAGKVANPSLWGAFAGGR